MFAKPSRHAAFAVLSLLAASLTTARATDIYTDKTAFLAHVDSDSCFEDFQGLTPSDSPDSLDFGGNGYAYTATAPINGLYIVKQNSDIYLSTDIATEPLVLTFTSGNVTAFGGNLFGTDFPGNFQAGAVTITLDDGTTTTITANSASDFIGFVSASNAPINSLTLTTTQPVGGIAFPTMNNVYAGRASQNVVPGPSSLVVLVGMASSGAFLFRKRARHA